jgi:hypothetical protein
MRRVIGLALLVIGVAPIGALLPLHHYYTIGISVDTTAILVISLFVVADLSLLVGGTYLLFRSV